METIYYHLNTRRVKISGGPDLITFSRCHTEPVPKGGGQLLDFERSKLRLERKTLLKGTLESEPYLYEAEDNSPTETAQPTAEPKSGKLFLGLDLLASGAVLAVCGVIIHAFTAIL